MSCFEIEVRVLAAEKADIRDAVEMREYQGQRLTPPYRLSQLQNKLHEFDLSPNLSVGMNESSGNPSQCFLSHRCRSWEAIQSREAKLLEMEKEKRATVCTVRTWSSAVVHTFTSCSNDILVQLRYILVVHAEWMNEWIILYLLTWLPVLGPFRSLSWIRELPSALHLHLDLHPQE